MKKIHETLGSSVDMNHSSSKCHGKFRKRDYFMKKKNSQGSSQIRTSQKEFYFPRSDLSQIVGHIDCMMRRSLLTDITNKITTLCCYSFHKSFSPGTLHLSHNTFKIFKKVHITYKYIMNVVWNSLLRFIITDELKFHEFVSISLSCAYKYWNLVSKGNF